MTEVHMIAHQVHEWLAGSELARAPKRMAIAARLILRHELDAPSQIASGLRVRGLVAGNHNDTGLFHTAAKSLFKKDAQQRLVGAVAVHQSLQRQGSLIAAGRGNDCLGYLQCSMIS